MMIADVLHGYMLYAMVWYNVLIFCYKHTTKEAGKPASIIVPRALTVARPSGRVNVELVGSVYTITIRLGKGFGWYGVVGPLLHLAEH